MTYELRDMTRADVPAVAALERALQGRTAWSAHGFHDALDLTPERYECRVALGPGDAAPVGYAVVSIAGPEGDAQAEVQNIAVAPDHQRRGLGTLLLHDLIARARRRGATELFLDVRAGNEAAIALYRGFGFTELARRAAYYGPGLDAVVMRLGLGAEALGTAEAGRSG